MDDPLYTGCRWGADINVRKIIVALPDDSRYWRDQPATLRFARDLPTSRVDPCREVRGRVKRCGRRRVLEQLLGASQIRVENGTSPLSR